MATMDERVAEDGRTDSECLGEILKIEVTSHLYLIYFPPLVFLDHLRIAPRRQRTKRIRTVSFIPCGLALADSGKP